MTTESLLKIFGMCEYCDGANLPTVSFACCFASMADRLKNEKPDKIGMYHKVIYGKYFKRG